MDTRDTREELESWAVKWDAAQAKWAAEEGSPLPKAKPAGNSFFGLQSQPLPGDEIDRGQGTDWTSIYTRSDEVPAHGPQHTEDDQMLQESNHWRRLLGPTNMAPKGPEKRRQAPSGPQNFREQAEGWRNLLKPPGEGTTFFQHPQHHTSIGMDQGKSPYEPTRVAPNFTDGDELRELSDMKAKLEKLESTLLSQEIKAGKANVAASDYKSKLDSLRKQIDSLSDQLTPRPGEDVY